MSTFEWSEEAIEAATKVGPFRYLSPEEQATEFRAREARDVLDAAVRAQPVTALPACPACDGEGTRVFNYGHTTNADGSLGGRGMRSITCPVCEGSGVGRVVSTSEVRAWIEARRRSFSPHDFPATAPMMLDDLARWLEERRD